MTAVEKSRGESQEALIKRFLRKVKKSGILKEVWDRKFYEKPSAKRNFKKRQRKRILEKLKKEREKEDI